MTPRLGAHWLAVFVLSFASLLACTALADGDGPAGIGVDEHLGAALPLDVPLRDHNGAPVTLRTYFDGNKPVVLVFGYHSCPMLCGLIQGAVVDALGSSDWAVGDEFDVVVLSIDPKDTPTLAAARRSVIEGRYMKARGGRWRPRAVDEGWHYVVGDEASIRAVTSAAGYRYAYDAEHQQYGHPAVITIATPDGRVARYLYGVEFEPRDMRFGLLEASQGRSMTTVERILIYCVHYDPVTGRYRVVVGRIMKLGAAAIAIALGALLSILWARERRRRGYLDASAAGVRTGSARHTAQ